MNVTKRPSPPNANARFDGLRPVGVSLDAIVKGLRAPMDLKAPRKLEKVK